MDTRLERLDGKSCTIGGEMATRFQELGAKLHTLEITLRAANHAATEIRAILIDATLDREFLELANKAPSEDARRVLSNHHTRDKKEPKCQASGTTSD